MVLLTEQTRLLGNEQPFINDATYYGVPTSWGTIHDYGNITLSEAGLVAFKCYVLMGPSSSGRVRLTIGTTVICGVCLGTGCAALLAGLCWLTAGTYDVLLEGVQSGAGSTASSMMLGFVKFLDSVGSPLAGYSSSIGLTVANRVGPAGPLKQATFAVQVAAYTPSAVTNFENVGETLTNGVSIRVDGTQVNWDERYNDNASGNMCSSAKLFYPCTVGASHTIAISKRTGSTAVNITIVASPWILPNTPNLSQPLTLSFPQGSTLYLTLEPLFSDETKFAGAGLVKSVSFGTTTDYYFSVTGTGILYFAFTYDNVEINAGCRVYGMGGCVSNAGVDAR